MTDSESPSTMFEQLFLWYDDAPRTVIYDNGCHLLDYALNRAPAWAKQLRILIDELHAKGHTSCANSFDTGEQPQDSSLFLCFVSFDCVCGACPYMSFSSVFATSHMYSRTIMALWSEGLCLYYKCSHLAHMARMEISELCACVRGALYMSLSLSLELERGALSLSSEVHSTIRCGAAAWPVRCCRATVQQRVRRRSECRAASVQCITLCAALPQHSAVPSVSKHIL